MDFLRGGRTLLALAALAGAFALGHLGCSEAPTFVVDGQGGGGSGGGGSSSSSSGGAPCQTSDDCPGDENECAHRICSAGMCGIDYAPKGFLVGAQAMGDCEKTICDGHGAIATAPDDSDKPNDGNACTLDLCAAGKPSHPPTTKGIPCGATQQLACDGAGQCAGCTTDAACGANTPCVSYMCDVGAMTCKITYVPTGTGNPGGQMVGDCKKNVCNGMGGTATVNDDTDVPNDGNACTQDLCSAGQPAHPPSPAGMACGGSFKCDGAGSCAGCLHSADCGQSNACVTFSCTGGTCNSTYVPAGQGNPGGAAGACKKNVCNGSGSPVGAPDDANTPNDNNPCTADQCSGGVPSNPPYAAGTACGGGLQCDGGGSCVGCLSGADCGGSSACVNHYCQAGSCYTSYASSGTGCGGNNICDGSGGCYCSDPGACNGRCGDLSDACNKPVSCGGCNAPQSCGGGGTANVCGCSAPGACNGKCGPITDGCNKPQTCGGCNAPETCGGGGVGSVCGCSDPNVCAGKCGPLTDACNKPVDCGATCAVYQTCGGAMPNICCSPLDCNACFDNSCPDYWDDGCGGQLDCYGNCGC